MDRIHRRTGSEQIHLERSIDSLPRLPSRRNSSGKRFSLLEEKWPREKKEKQSFR